MEMIAHRRSPSSRNDSRPARAQRANDERRPTILVVDDDQANLLLARTLLESEGFDVCVATDAISTFEVLKTHQPALILMDVQLPGMDGWELTRRLRRNTATRHIPVIALTAFHHSGDADRAREAGCVEFVAKPISTRELPNIVRRHMLPSTM